MTDLDPTRNATLTCPHCGAQNDGSRRVCADCGSELTDAPTERNRGDLEVEEVWRGAAAAGFDEEARVRETDLLCPVCDAHFDVAQAAGAHQQRAADTAGRGDDVVVLTLACPNCGTRLRAQVPGAWPGMPAAGVGDDDRDMPGIKSKSPPHDPDAPWVKTAVSKDDPLGSDLGRFAPASAGSLRDQGPLTDETGADIREYTGEPVETDDGWVLPQQQNVGPGNEAGSGEWPDPDVPSANPGED